MRDVEVPDWLKKLPLAPEFRPTDTEFADPIAYISKIEKEAGVFGICKVIPPLPKPSKKYVLHNLNKSLSKCPDLVSEVTSVSSSGDGRALFTTRQQELGQNDKRVKGRVGSQTVGAQKQVWQSGEAYTLEQFELKSKNFAKCQFSGVKEVSPIIIESMFWKASTEKPIYVEYANDVPGSGFSELEGPFKYLHRRKRRRRKRGTFDRNNVDSTDSKNVQVYRSSSITHCDSLDDKPDNPKTKASLSCGYSQPDQSENPSVQKSFNSGERDRTSGWKLSNSPWNLQVIARSPGSLTRFMPDDIPGVTSPMIYIGMLFSWFAWHVEDHELHSLNYLHMGSPKTWYAVPGDYASTFEEVIGIHAYGGNVDRLDALTILGEKTTLLSPEVIIKSGIPCCRLVQNPGEFVVTFPRAYHVGFSHGYNCGEAANFGTPKWLTVAKEAAVRRAAMNYLPMLSHQQLLYLLTMSFISRIPRSLLLGERTSRLRNRQKEERELSVKKAFLEDLLKENKLLSILLQKMPSQRVVMWDLNMLPSSIKVSQLSNSSGVSRESNHSDCSSSQDLYTEMNLFMDNVLDLYADDADDLLHDYQVDSGTLPCVACGILGFPFMAIVQPSEQAAKVLLAEDHEVIQQLGVSKLMNDHSSVSAIMSKGFVNEDTSKSMEETLLQHSNEAPFSARRVQCTDHPEPVAVPAAGEPEELKSSDGFLSPRIFCLEHAIQTVDLLLPRGGSNVLGICHSDFKKIKAHAAVIAEDICVSFTYNEISLDDASPEDLFLIDCATDEQERDLITKDWTARLGINLRHCVKVKKTDPSHKVKHALNIGGLFSEELSCSNAFKWHSRRLQSKKSLDPTNLAKIVENVVVGRVEDPHTLQDVAADGKSGTIVSQYYKRKTKSRPSVLKGIGCDQLSSELPDCRDPSKTTDDISQNAGVAAEGTAVGLSGLSRSSTSTVLQNEDPVNMLSENLSNNSSTLQSVELRTVTTSVGESNGNQTGSCAKSLLSELDSASGSPSCDIQESFCMPDMDNSQKSSCLLDDSACSNENGLMHYENSAHDEVLADDGEKPRKASDKEDVVVKDTSCSINLPNEVVGERHDKNIETIDGQDNRGISLCCETLNSQHMQMKDGSGPETSMADDDLLKLNASGEMHTCEQLQSGSPILSLQENIKLSGAVTPKVSPPPSVPIRKRKREVDVLNENHHSLDSFIRSPCECLRPRAKTHAALNSSDGKEAIENVDRSRNLKKNGDVSVAGKGKVEVQKKGCHKCRIVGCRMSFQTKTELALHSRNRCPVEGCGKKFSCHKYAVVHQRVHDDDRPLKCPWKGCRMTFKWAWARTEHLRVHTGERPYKCEIEGCGLTFRFVSDFSRHRRKTGHYVG